MRLNQQCNKLALFANTITEIRGTITMLVYYNVDLAFVTQLVPLVIIIKGFQMMCKRIGQPVCPL